MASDDPQRPREPTEGSPDVPDGDPSPADDDTGSSEKDPSAEKTGVPPEGTDPMAGEAPSG